MKKVAIKKKIAYLLFPLLLATVLAIGMCVDFFGSRKKAEILMLGDSNLDIIRNETGVAELTELYTGKTVLNGSFGGTMLSGLQADTVDDAMQLFSLVSLSESLRNRDFSPQRATIDLVEINRFYASTVSELDKIDGKSVEIIIIEHGFNDYGAEVLLDDEDNPYNPQTFGGAIRYSVERLKKSFPNARIILVAPTPACWYRGEAYTEYASLEDYAAKEAELAQELGIEFIDNFHECFPDTQEAVDMYTEDGVHLSEEGRRLAAENIVAYLKATETK